MAENTFRNWFVRFRNGHFGLENREGTRSLVVIDDGPIEKKMIKNNASLRTQKITGKIHLLLALLRI